MTNILDLIDRAINDCTMGPDAMRWTPESPEPERTFRYAPQFDQQFQWATFIIDREMRVDTIYCETVRYPLPEPVDVPAGSRVSVSIDRDGTPSVTITEASETERGTPAVFDPPWWGHQYAIMGTVPGVH